MNGSLFNIVKRDIKRVINSGGYQVDIEIKTPDNVKTINITGWAVKHFYSFDTDGNQTSTKTARVTVDENVLKANNYPYRTNKKGILEVDLQNHIVKFTDSSGNLCNYKVTRSVPDENFGLIVLILGDYIP
jgi:hypothetical protein